MNRPEMRLRLWFATSVELKIEVWSHFSFTLVSTKPAMSLTLQSCALTVAFTRYCPKNDRLGVETQRLSFCPESEKVRGSNTDRGGQKERRGH